MVVEGRRPLNLNVGLWTLSVRGTEDRVLSQLERGVSRTPPGGVEGTYGYPRERPVEET